MQQSILTRRGPISADRMLGHSDVAPARKQDPGEKFPWESAERIPASAIGCARRRSISKASRCEPGDHGDAVTRLQRTLHDYGYGIEETGRYDDATRDVVTAFQRHFRPARVDGIADPSTLLTLRALVETRPSPLALSFARGLAA